MYTDPPRILCTEDDTGTEWIRELLNGKSLNCTVEGAVCGREAFMRIMNGKYDLFVTEYPLSDMTGVQLCSLLRHSGSSTPIMFFTAMSRPIDREKAMAAGADEYLCKPDDIDLFADAVSHLLKRRRRVYFRPPEMQKFLKAA